MNETSNSSSSAITIDSVQIEQTDITLNITQNTNSSSTKHSCKPVYIGVSVIVFIGISCALILTLFA